MASYIASATNNIRLVVDEITAKEGVTVRLGLIEYRDHPPQVSVYTWILTPKKCNTDEID